MYYTPVSSWALHPLLSLSDKAAQLFSSFRHLCSHLHAPPQLLLFISHIILTWRYSYGEQAKKEMVDTYSTNSDLYFREYEHSPELPSHSALSKYTQMSCRIAFTLCTSSQDVFSF